MKLKFFPKLSIWLDENELRGQIIKGSTGSFLIYIVFAALSLALSMGLTRILGAEGYGAYSNAIAWSNIFIPFATFGFTTLLVKEIAIYRSQKNWQFIKGLLKFVDVCVLILSILLIVVFYCLSRMIFADPEKSVLLRAMLVAIPLIPLWAFAYIRQSSILGFENATRSLIPDMIIRPGLAVAVIFVLFLIWPERLNIDAVMVISLFGSAIALLVAINWLRKALPPEYYLVKPKYNKKIWLKTSIPLFIFGSMQIILPQIPIVMLGGLSYAEQVGLFSATYRLANVLAFLPGAVRIVMGPIMARMHANDESKKLQKLITLTIRGTFLFDLFLGIGFLLLRRPLLSIFGPQFIQAEWALIILIISNLLDVILGNSSVLLTMTGKERVVALSYVSAVITNIILNILLIPKYRYVGATLTSGFSLILVKTILSVYTIKKMRLNPTLFSRLRS
jgi:O-antigen/teichoic acid export membrane protein